MQQQILECKKRKIGGETNPLYTIAYEVIFFLLKCRNIKFVIFFKLSAKTGEYLKTTPSAAQDPECIKQFLKEIAKFNLRKAEKIVILNLRPTTEIELNLVQNQSTLNR